MAGGALADDFDRYHVTDRNASFFSVARQSDARPSDVRPSDDPGLASVSRGASPDCPRNALARPIDYLVTIRLLSGQRGLAAGQQTLLRL